jgi:thiamine biosynthesis protein ThiI
LSVSSGEPARRVALLRFSGELSTKARATRLQFRARLVHNLRDALSSEGAAARLEVSHTRIFAHLSDSTSLREELALREHPLTRVFGLQSISFVERHPAPDLASVVRIGEELFREAVRGRRFAIRARRVGERHKTPVRSSDVARELGSALLPISAGVDLSNPEVSARIELSEGEASFFTERIPGQGGLPLGVEGRAVALMSGGFDSAVAAWQLARRGVALDFVFCNLGGQSHLQGVVRVAKVLADRWSYGHTPRLHALDFEPVAAAIREHTETRYWQVILKRMMLRAAEAVAVERRAVAIVTGDAVGQVSSQTLQNLAVVSRATLIPILRPLVGANKDEIIALAEQIGTFELSKVVGEYCAMVPHRPATRAALRTVEEQEARLEPGLAEKAAAARSVLDLRALELTSLDDPDLAIERPPPDAQLIDLRPLAQYRGGHHPDALHLDFAQALEAFPSFDRAGLYVLSCEFGLMSAHLAEVMRRAGFRAHSLRGGQAALMKRA